MIDEFHITTFIVINFVLFILSLMYMVLGSVILFRVRDILRTFPMTSAGFYCFKIGVSLFAAHAFGYIGQDRDSYLALYGYVAFMMIMIIYEIYCATLLTKIVSKPDDNAKVWVLKAYSDDIMSSFTIEYIFQCCGPLDSTYYFTYAVALPPTCCGSYQVIDLLGCYYHNCHKDGCIYAVNRYLNDNSQRVLFLIFLTIVTEIAGIINGLMVAKFFREYRNFIEEETAAETLRDLEKNNWSKF